MNEAIEVVIFKAKSGVSDGRYIDVVHWKDLPSAKAAAEKGMNIPKCSEFFGLIDQNQMQFIHFTKIA